MDLVTTKIVWQDGTIYHQEAQDVEPIQRHVKYLIDSAQLGEPEMRHAAKVPTSIHEQFKLKHGFSDYDMTRPEIISRLLNSEEVRQYRIWQGKV